MEKNAERSAEGILLSIQKSILNILKNNASGEKNGLKEILIMRKNFIIDIVKKISLR